MKGNTERTIYSPLLTPLTASTEKTLSGSSSMDQESGDRPAYLDYEPRTFIKGDTKHFTYRSCFDRLGFDHWDNETALEARLQFIRDLRAHLCVPETRCLRRKDNPAAFRALILGFLEKHGQMYFGKANRAHLAEKDPRKGFLYPRDAQRDGSRFIAMFEDLFDYKADCFWKRESRKDKERKVIPHLDFASLQPSEINSIGKDHTKISIEGSLRVLRKVQQRSMEALINKSDDDGDLNNNEQEHLEESLERDDEGLNGFRDVRGIRKSRRISKPIEWDDGILRGQLLADAEKQFLNTPQTAPSIKTSEQQRKISQGKSAFADTTSTATKAPKLGALAATGPNRRVHNMTGAIASIRKRSKSTRTTPSAAETLITPRCTAHRSSAKTQPARRSAKNVAPVTPLSEITGHFTPSSAAILISDEVDDDDNVVLSNTSFSNVDPRHMSDGEGTFTPFSQLPKAGPKVKTEQLSSEIKKNTVLCVIASNQQDMAPVSVRLDCYHASENLIDFLAAECELEILANSVTAVSATYTWDNDKKLRLRRSRLDIDWTTFCAQLRDAYVKHPEFYTRGCEVGMLLHIAA